MPVTGHEQVLRLQIAVHDALAVRRGKAFRNLVAQLDGLLRRKGTTIQHLPERLPFEQFHHNEVSSAGCPNFVNGEDVGCDSAATAFASRSNRSRAS